MRLTEPRQSFVFTNVVERPVLSLNRGFSAPVKLTMPIDPEHLCFLAAHDCDPFNRWQAIQTSAMTLLKNNVAAIRSGDGPGLADEGLMDALGATLNGPALEPAFVALALSPPSEPDIAREIGHDVDPDAVFAARRKLRAAIGVRHSGLLTATYERIVTPGLIGRTRKALAGARSRMLALIFWR